MTEIGKPAPEGGATFLYSFPEENPVLSKILNEGKCLLFNDREFFHFISPLQALFSEGGVRDVFVLTCLGLIAPKTDKSTN